MSRYVVDTNFFIQCRGANEVPWDLITTDAEIVVLVARAVQEEIDRFKQDGNVRRSKRARIAARLFRQAVRNKHDPFQVVVREKDPKVTLCLLNRIKPIEGTPASLDIDHYDDRIVADALTLRAAGEAVEILTGDTGMMMTAAEHDVPFVETPEDWLLPPEPDERSKELQDLRQRVESLEQPGPRLQLAFLDAEDREVSTLSINAVTYQVDDKLIDVAVERVRARHPIVTDFQRDAPPRAKSDPSDAFAAVTAAFTEKQWQSPSEESIRKYREKDYPEWIDLVRRTIVEGIRFHERRSRHAFFTVVLSNEGIRPAENVIIEFKASPGIKLANAAPGQRDVGIPAPPAAPSGKWVSRYPFLDNQRAPISFNPLIGGGLPTEKPKRDRYGFYWVPRRPDRPVSKWRFECDEFRHGVSPESFDVHVQLAKDCAPGREAVRVQVSAANQASVVNAVLPIVVAVVEDVSSSEVIDRISLKPTIGDG
jgi:hypothetical protein